MVNLHIKRRILPVIIFCGMIQTAFASTPAEEDDIANACKPYLEQYNPQQDPNTLPPAAQAALTACSAHGSCQTSILSGIPDCAIKLNALQPNQTPPLSVIQNKPATAPAPYVSPAQKNNGWGLPSATPTPGAEPQQTPDINTSPDTTSDTDTTTTNAPPVTPPPAQPASPTPPAPPTSPAPTQPQNDQSTTPNINWF